MYESIYPKDAKKLVDWLKLDSTQPTQPYRQLAKVLRETGDSNGSIRVLEAMEANLTRGYMRPILAPIGYGYEPENAIWGLLGVTFIGALMYWRAQRMRKMVPTDKDACELFKATPSILPPHYPRFHPLIFSLENTFPIVKLGQTEKWQPDPQITPTPPGLRLSKRFILWFVWIQILVGWILATLFVAAISGFVQHS